jgi:hypothetical protein
MGFKPAGRQPDAQNLPGLDRCLEPFKGKGAVICELEFISCKTFRRMVND